MSIREATRLVIDSSIIAVGGEVLVTKMPVIRIKDLAEVMIRVLAPIYNYSSDHIRIKTVGMKAGEKLYEELMNNEETRRAFELESYFVVLPAFRSIYRDIEYEYDNIVSTNISRAYNSNNEKPISQEQLQNFLCSNRLV